MNAPTTRGAAIAAFCRQCIYDRDACGTWREQVAACGTTACPLWRFRPLPANAPAWLRSSDPEKLPAGWSRIDPAANIGLWNPENRPSVGVETPRGTGAMVTPRVGTP